MCVQDQLGRWDDRKNAWAECMDIYSVQCPKFGGEILVLSQVQVAIVVVHMGMLEHETTALYQIRHRDKRLD